MRRSSSTHKKNETMREIKAHDDDVRDTRDTR